MLTLLQNYIAISQSESISVSKRDPLLYSTHRDTRPSMFYFTFSSLNWPFPLCDCKLFFSSPHDAIINWKHYWSFVRGIHRSPVNSPHKGQWRGALMFYFLCPNKRLRKQSWGWWCETLSRSLWRHRNGSHIMIYGMQLTPWMQNDTNTYSW